MAALYALSVLCWWRVARTVGAAPGVVIAGLLLAYPSYVLLFHRLASDAFFAAAFALAALLTARLVESRTPGRAAAVGLALALLVLIRPVSQILVVLAPLLLLGRGAWRPRMATLTAFGVAVAVPLLLWAGAQRGACGRLHGRARRGPRRFRSTARSSSTGSSRRRTAARPRELARAVEDDLLPGAVPLVRDRSRHVLRLGQRAHARGSHRPRRPHVGLGRRLRASRARRPRGGPRASRHVRARRGARLLAAALVAGLPPGRRERDGSAVRGLESVVAAARADRGSADPVRERVVVHLDARTVGSGRSGRRRASTRSSPTTPADAAHLDRMNRRVAELVGRFRTAREAPSSARWLDRASRWFPRPAFWLVVGLVALRRTPAAARGDAARAHRCRAVRDRRHVSGGSRCRGVLDPVAPAFMSCSRVAALLGARAARRGRKQRRGTASPTPRAGARDPWLRRSLGFAAPPAPAPRSRRVRTPSACTARPAERVSSRCRGRWCEPWTCELVVRTTGAPDGQWTPATPSGASVAVSGVWEPNVDGGRASACSAPGDVFVDSARTIGVLHAASPARPRRALRAACTPSSRRLRDTENCVRTSRAMGREERVGIRASPPAVDPDRDAARELRGRTRAHRRSSAGR